MLAFVGALMAAALLAGGCAGGGDDESAPAGTTSAPSGEWTAYAPIATGWAAHADTFCSTLLDRFERALHPTDPARYRAGIEEALRLARADLDAFEDVGPPARATYGVNVLAAALGVHLVALDELAEAADEGNEGRARVALERAADARRRAEPFARRLGLSACAEASAR